MSGLAGRISFRFPCSLPGVCRIGCLTDPDLMCIHAPSGLSMINEPTSRTYLLISLFRRTAISGTILCISVLERGRDYANG